MTVHYLPAPPLRVVEQDGHRVLIHGGHYATLMTETNATRVAQALQTLADFHLALPPTEPPSAA
jgi:hypothetical protein